MRRKSSSIVVEITTIALLSALGFILMSFCRFPYPIAPWLMIEISDIVVFIAYAIYGFSGAFAVSVLKTALDLAVYGLVGPFGIGNITAAITSLTFTFLLLIAAHLLRLFNKGFKFRILGYTFITLSEALLLTIFNYIFITPTFITGTFTTCFNSEAVAAVVEGMKEYFNGFSYSAIIFIVYFPFNLIKGVVSCFLYELIFNRLIFVIFQRSDKMRNLFFNKNEINDKENQDKNKEENR